MPQAQSLLSHQPLRFPFSKAGGLAPVPGDRRWPSGQRVALAQQCPSISTNQCNALPRPLCSWERSQTCSLCDITSRQLKKRKPPSPKQGHCMQLGPWEIPAPPSSVPCANRRAPALLHGMDGRVSRRLDGGSLDGCEPPLLAGQGRGQKGARSLAEGRLGVNESAALKTLGHKIMPPLSEMVRSEAGSHQRQGDGHFLGPFLGTSLRMPRV